MSETPTAAAVEAARLAKVREWAISEPAGDRSGFCRLCYSLAITTTHVTGYWERGEPERHAPDCPAAPAPAAPMEDAP